MMRRVLSPLLAFLFLVGCNKMCNSGRDDMTPEQVVQTYLNISLNMTKVEEKQELLKLTTGDLKSALEQASDEIITNAFLKQNYKLEAYSVVERRDRTPRETEITFLLRYKNLGPNKSIPIDQAPEVKTENTLSVIKHDGAWYIRDVIGKKTTIDFAMEEEIKANPGPGIDEPPPAEEEAPPVGEQQNPQ